MGPFDNSNTDSNSLYNPNLLSSATQQKLGLLAVKRDEKINTLSGNTDADSGDNWRLSNADAPEVYHDNLNERKKVYMQYATINNTSLDEAKQQVDSEALAYRIAKDNGYDLGKQVEDARNQGLLGTDYKPSSFEMYRLGDRANEYVNRQSALNPDSGLLKYKQTGQQDVYGRQLVDNEQFVNRGLEAGYYVPGSTDKANFEQQSNLMNQAIKNKQGLYDTPTNTSIMKAISDSSFANAQVNPQPQYDTSNSNLVDALQASLGTSGASIGDVIADTGLKATKSIIGSFSDEAKGKDVFVRDTNNMTEKDKYINNTIMGTIKDTPLENMFKKTTYGQVNFTGLDEAKKQEFYGYKASDELQGVQTNLNKAYKSGDVLEMGKALVGAIAKPEAIVEVLATSVGEIGLAATGVGTVGLIMGKANDILEARSKITGKEPTEEDVMYASAGATVYGLVNKMTSGMASINTIKEATKSLTNNLTEVGLISTLQVIKDISKGTGKAYGIEGGEEVIQSLAENIGTKLGTEKANEILNQDAQAELFTSFGLGAAAGGVTHTAIDTPRKFYEQNKNNKPLDTINRVVENLSPEERTKVNEVVTNTINTSENTINNTNLNIDTINSTDDLASLMSNATQIMNSIHQQIQSGNTPDETTLNEYAKQGQLLEAIDAITSKEANSTFMDSTVNAISSMAPNVAQAIDTSTSVTSPNRGLIDTLNTTITSMNLEPIENFSELQTKYSDKLPSILSNLQKTGQAGQVFGALSGVLKLKTVTQAKAELVQQPEFKSKLVSLLTNSARAIEKDTGIVRFKQKALTENKYPNRQTKTGLSENFNAKTIIDSGVLTKLNGISQVTNQLQEYDTATLKELQGTLVNYAGTKGLNKLNTAINDILHVRNQATKAESKILSVTEPITDTTSPDYTTDSNGVTTPTDSTTTSTTEPDVNDEPVDEQGITESTHSEIVQQGQKIVPTTVDDIKQDLANINENLCK